MPVRVGLTLSAVCVAALLVSTAVASTGAARSASVKIAVPATGHFSITPIAVTTKSGKKPKLQIVGTVAKNLVVGAGLTADPKQKGRFIGLVVLINRKTSSTTKARNIQTAARGALEFVDIAFTPKGIANVPTKRLSHRWMLHGHMTLDDWGFLTPPPATNSTQFMNASLAAYFGGNFGTFDGAAAGNTFLNSLARNSIGITGAAGPTLGPLQGCVFPNNVTSSSTDLEIKASETGAAGDTGTVHFVGMGLDVMKPFTLDANGVAVVPVTVTSFGTPMITVTLATTPPQRSTFTYTLDSPHDVALTDCTTTTH